MKGNNNIQGGGTDLSRSLSMQQVADILQSCVRTVRREIDRGRLKAFRVGRKIRISVEELQRYMERELAAV